MFISFSALCKKIVASVEDSCMNLNCPSGNGMQAPLNFAKLNVKVNLKDDTGYLIGCRLTGDIAERVLGCTLDVFQVTYLNCLKCKLKRSNCFSQLSFLT